MFLVRPTRYRLNSINQRVSKYSEWLNDNGVRLDGVRIIPDPTSPLLHSFVFDRDLPQNYVCGVIPAALRVDVMNAGVGTVIRDDILAFITSARDTLSRDILSSIPHLAETLAYLPPDLSFTTRGPIDPLASHPRDISRIASQPLTLALNAIDAALAVLSDIEERNAFAPWTSLWPRSHTSIAAASPFTDTLRGWNPRNPAEPPLDAVPPAVLREVAASRHRRAAARAAIPTSSPPTATTSPTPTSAGPADATPAEGTSGIAGTAAVRARAFPLFASRRGVQLIAGLSLTAAAWDVVGAFLPPSVDTAFCGANAGALHWAVSTILASAGDVSGLTQRPAFRLPSRAPVIDALPLVARGDAAVAAVWPSAEAADDPVARAAEAAGARPVGRYLVTCRAVKAGEPLSVLCAETDDTWAGMAASRRDVWGALALQSTRDDGTETNRLCDDDDASDGLGRVFSDREDWEVELNGHDGLTMDTQVMFAVAD